MRKLNIGLLVAMTFIGSLSAKTYTDKKFLTPRSHNENLAMEYTTWHKQTSIIDEDKWGGAVQATAFYQESTNKTDLGKYFGIYNWLTAQQRIQDFIQVKDDATNSPLLPKNIIHDPNNTVTEMLHVKGTFRPKQTSYGVRLDFNQKLDKLARGLYFKVTAPIVKVKNDMGITYSGGTLTQTVPGLDVKKSLADFLAGGVATTTQDALTHAKIAGSDSTTGVADVDVALGYNFLYEDTKHVGAKVCLTIPTGGSPDGVKLFEARVGNNGHWALGLGVDGKFELWKDDNKSLDLGFAFNYKYLFNATEKRTLDFKFSDSISDTALAGKHVMYGHYRLAGKRASSKLFPLANVLTQDVGVEPGSQVEGLVDFAFNCGNFTFDLGYNFYAREAENVSVKSWSNGTYAMVRTTAPIPYDTSGVENFFDPTDPVYAYDGTSDTVQVPIHRDHLMPETAASPVYVTHKIFTGFGYAWNKWNYPVMAGVGGSWEFVQGSNAALDGWALWAKLGLRF